MDQVKRSADNDKLREEKHLQEPQRRDAEKVTADQEMRQITDRHNELQQKLLAEVEAKRVQLAKDKSRVTDEIMRSRTRWWSVQSKNKKKRSGHCWDRNVPKAHPNPSFTT